MKIVKGQILKDEDFIDAVDDLIRIQGALKMFRNLHFSLDECGYIWAGYSNNLAAQWLFLPKMDQEIPEYIESDSYFVSYQNHIEDGTK